MYFNGVFIDEELKTGLIQLAEPPDLAEIFAKKKKRRRKN